MFNNKLKEELSDVTRELRDLKALLLVEDYFYVRGPYNFGKFISKAEAVSFKVLQRKWDYMQISTRFTSKKNYKDYISFIEKREEEVKKYEKNNK